MNIFTRIFGNRKATAANDSQSPSRPHSQVASGQSQHSQSAAATLSTTRRELLRVVLRDTLIRHGIPAGWITAEMLTATSRTRAAGVHWRLAVRHWDPRLFSYCVALEKSLISRLQSFDPMAETWLFGISWQILLGDESACPPMPHPGLWTADPPRVVEPSVQKPMPGGSADVIAGPVRIRAARADAASDLEQLMAAREADFRANAQGNSEATQPMDIHTEPGKL